jgi:hypothetical protein
MDFIDLVDTMILGANTPLGAIVGGAVGSLGAVLRPSALTDRRGATGA